MRLSRLVPTLALLLAACNAERPAPLPDTPAPLDLLALPTLAGERFDPAVLAGKLVIVNFWSPT